MKIIQNYPPVTNQELSALEGRLGVRLPDDYRDFLRAQNGGRPKPNVFRTQDGTGSSIDWFLAVHNGLFDSFERYFINYKVKRRALPENLIPIGHDPGGNLICLSIQGEDAGSVYFWNHEKETSPPTYANVHRIADSLAGLLTSLHEPPKDEWMEINLMMMRKDTGALESLIQSGWDVNTVNPVRRDTLLEACAFSNAIDFMKVLLAHGAQVGSALERAEKRNVFDHSTKEAIELLKEHSRKHPVL